MSKSPDIALFSTWVPLATLEKASSDIPDVTQDIKGGIAGIISSDSQDLQGDTILQEGMEWDYFLTRGWLNYEHKQGPEWIVGAPKKVEHVTLDNGNQATRIEGDLFLNRPRGREVYESAKAIQKAGNGRSIGFSVEGQVLERDSKDPSVVTRARILNVSITAHPVNPDARLEVLARSLIGYQEGTVSDAGAALSPLAEQSLEQSPTEASIYNIVQKVLSKEMGKMMSEEIDKMMSSAISPNNNRKVMVSLLQLQKLLGKVFPQLPTSEQRAMASALLGAAKGYK